uniref:Uncharacterized protein n=1 Tax=uncultured marine virus TaxID=186617 RepID=A0A0F7L482_9VIRU|nr:hypothetical protein [uncultured marine virus]
MFFRPVFFRGVAISNQGRVSNHHQSIRHTLWACCNEGKADQRQACRYPCNEYTGQSPLCNLRSRSLWCLCTEGNRVLFLFRS